MKRKPKGPRQVVLTDDMIASRLAHADAQRIFDERMERGEYDETLRPIQERMRAYRESHGLEADEDWALDEMPPEYQALEDQWERAADELFAEILRSQGYRAMAELLLNGPEEYDRRLGLATEGIS